VEVEVEELLPPPRGVKVLPLVAAEVGAASAVTR
jgi:hypothetical protein